MHKLAVVHEGDLVVRPVDAGSGSWESVLDGEDEKSHRSNPPAGGVPATEILDTLLGVTGGTKRHLGPWCT
jgi:hypothetical protein